VPCSIALHEYGFGKFVTSVMGGFYSCRPALLRCGPSAMRGPLPLWPICHLTECAVRWPATTAFEFPVVSCGREGNLKGWQRRWGEAAAEWGDRNRR